jgi:hypothetical protein
MKKLENKYLIKLENPLEERNKEDLLDLVDKKMLTSDDLKKFILNNKKLGTDT